ncbi:MAG: gliding motility-associated C-terminal domain-containing protein [Chitinophagaceae bacterium]|nr:gliding motility-associated C-terminal domain-containing protein [Chitinophagaceae bacterium]
MRHRCYCANDTITQDVTIDNVMNLSASVATNDNNACAGEEMVFTATTNATDPSYQWQVNGVDAGNNSAVFSSNTLNSNDEVSCIITTSDACAGSVVSNSITVLITPAVTPQVTISASVTDICQGEEITLTATATHGGSAPVFQWQVNGLNAGNNSSSFSGNTFNSNDAVSCILTSNASCINKSKDTSDMVIIHVTTSVTPSIEITTTSAAACQNETILFNSTIQHGGSAPQYQWQVNEVDAGTAPTFSSTALNDGDVIRCILTSNVAACITRVTDTSDAVTIAISETITPRLSISASSASICTGATVAFNAIAENAGSAPAYQWYINDVAVNETGQQFSGSNFSDGDVIKCIVTSNAACAAPANTAADELALSVSDVVTSVTQKLICEGENYWGYTTAGTYTDQFVSAAGCDSIRTLYLEVGMNPVPSLGKDTSICAGEALQLSPGQFSSYLWQNGSTQSSITATAAGTYTVTVTNECGSSTATITIAEKACGDIWFPSAFTPNGDNINDKFGVLNAGILESYYLAVYNRWGEKIFETTNPARAWDGKTKGTASPTGIYTWYSVFKKSGQVYQKKGYVTIIR